MSRVVRVGRKLAIYIPKDVAESLELREGDSMIFEVIDSKIVFTFIKPVKRHEFWGEVSVGEVEEVGEEITWKVTEGEW